MEPIASMAPAATPAPPAPLSGAEAMFFENFYNGLHEGLVTLVNLSVVLLEFIGVGVIVVAALQGIYNYVRRDPLTRLKLAKGMAMGLEFKLGSEILRTVVVRQFSEIAIVGAIAGFTAIGVWLDDTQGIAVDNISTRGYSGLSLVSIPAARCTQMEAIVPYDAIVLQYGLNVMTPEILHYESYARKMVAVINHLKACYPNTDIILMGVGDRSRKLNGSFTTMPAVLALSRAQRLAAKNAGVVFWDTFAAMGGHNGMVDYVAQKQANKDYTHINHKGGRRLAGEFVKSLEYSLNRNGL